MLVDSLILRDENNKLILEIYDFENDEFVSNNDAMFEQKIFKLATKYDAHFIYSTFVSHNHHENNEKLIYSKNKE